MIKPADQEYVIPSPMQEVKMDLLDRKTIRLFIKRDDLIHPWLSGNKYRKLKYNLQFAQENGKRTIITFGGSFSNHLYATAGACSLYGFKSVGIVRGEYDSNNPTIRFCESRGMELWFVPRSTYRLKEEADIVKDIIGQYNDVYLVPEGGSNALAIYGVAEIIPEIEDQLSCMPSYITLACGTGGTTAGLLSVQNMASKIIAFSALNSDHLYDEVIKLIPHKNIDAQKLTVNHDFHFGHYAAYNDELLQFMSDFESLTNIPLDHVYNGKALYGLFQLVEKDYFPERTTICHLHTGGLQGINGLKYMMGKKINHQGVKE
jgi:1-aminocyclopropane-1-carboxylate deaminase/D-cysteine desulfhydrase-like pyridoxal-dependent ACC family enzyme